VSTREDRAVPRQILTLFNVGAIRELTDGQLLERFANGRSEVAELSFAALVERHGPMVLRVCRGVLPDPHDADDAFQATFLVLLKKARGLWVRDSLGPWLHQVALRTSSYARTAAVRRRRHERRAADLAATAGPAGHESGSDDGWEQVLHAEIDRLPERYRVPIVLCDLQGRSHEQAARHTGWPVGTVKSRLSRARERLRGRLLRRGLSPLVSPLATPFPTSLVNLTTKAALQTATGRTIARGAAATLAKGVLGSMAMTWWIKIASVLLAVAATVGGVPLLAPKEAAVAGPRPEANAEAAQADDAPVSEVKSGKFTFVISERGSLESSNNLDVYNKVEGQTTIIQLLPEGTRVNKGDIVCELDSSALKDSLVNQVIAVKGAEAAYQNAKLAREVAEIALVEYEQGVYVQQLGAVKGEVSAAELAIRKAAERLERTDGARKRLRDVLRPKGEDRTPAEVVAELDIDDRLDEAAQALARAKTALEQAQTKQSVLMRFTRDKTIKELRSEVEKARTIELARQSDWELAKSKEAKLRTQIANCTLRAPGGGLVVYANDPTRFGTAPRPQIEEGVGVRERQKIFSIPDITQLQVNTKVHEALVDRITPGLRAQIKVDAFPDETLVGVVKDVYPLPDASYFFSSDVKVYTTHVSIEKPLQGLRPGMSSQVEILVAERDDVLSVPVSSVVYYDSKDHVAVKKPGGGFDWREVTLGPSDDKVVVVKEGLKSGEAVAVDSAPLLSEEQKRKISASPPRPRPVTRPAAKAKGKAAGLPAALRTKLQAMAPEERAKMKDASREERDAMLRKAGLDDDEIRLINRLGQQPGTPR
jgi:RNA polymerase sigma factor (sigma-70 family)